MRFFSKLILAGIGVILILYFIKNGIFYKDKNRSFVDEEEKEEQRTYTKEEFKSILIGKWDINWANEISNKKTFFAGKVSYKRDQTFDMTATIRVEYSGEDRYSSSIVIYAGYVSGVWTVENSLSWQEVIHSCTLKQSYQSEAFRSDKGGLDPCIAIDRGSFGAEKDFVTIVSKSITDSSIYIQSYNSATTEKFEYNFKKL